MIQKKILELLAGADDHKDINGAKKLSLEAIEALADLEIALMEEEEDVEFNSKDYDFLSQAKLKIKEVEKNSNHHDSLSSRISSREAENEAPSNVKAFISYSKENYDNEKIDSFITKIQNRLNPLNVNLWKDKNIAQEVIYTCISDRKKRDAEVTASKNTKPVHITNFHPSAENMRMNTSVLTEIVMARMRNLTPLLRETLDEEGFCGSKIVTQNRLHSAFFEGGERTTYTTVFEEGGEPAYTAFFEEGDEPVYTIFHTHGETKHWEKNNEELMNSPISKMSGVLKIDSIRGKIIGQLDNFIPDNGKLSFIFDPCNQNISFMEADSKELIRYERKPSKFSKGISYNN